MNIVQPLRSKTAVQRISRAMRDRSPRDYVLLRMGMCLGRRISDLLALRVSDVLAGAGKRVQIAKRLRLVERKTGKRIELPLKEVLRADIARYIREKGLEPDDPLFLSRKRGDSGERRPISRWTAWHSLRKAAEKVGIEDPIGTHSMRKTFGYHLYKEGVDITRIQALLNHSSPEVTLRYIGITRDELDGYVETLDI